MATLLSIDPEIDKRVGELGRRLLAQARKNAKAAKSEHRWLDRFMQRIMENEKFRVQALRFVDVLPTLDDDADLVRHLQEYFSDDEVPLTGLVRLGLRHIRTRPSDKLVAKAVRSAIEKLARRFMGGANADEALAVAKELRLRGIGFSLDLLGEATVSEEEGELYKTHYQQLLHCAPRQLEEWAPNPLLDRAGGRQVPRLNVSLKVSSLYSQINRLDPDSTIKGISSRLRPILLAAQRNGAFVFLDMEQYDLKNVTLACFRQLLMEPELREWPGAGIALQTYLLDTERDLSELIDWAKTRKTPVTVRLVRGAYWDYETVVARQSGWPLPTWPEKWRTDACYERCVQRLFENYPYIEAAIATHNVRSLALAMILAGEYGLSPEQFEFQMLYGMAKSLEDVIPAMGYRLRVYLPYGELIPGMAYLVRRLLENSSSQSFQRMSLLKDLPPAQLLAPPHAQFQSAALSEESAFHPEPSATTPAIKYTDKRDETGRPKVTEFINESVHRFTDPSEREHFQHAIDEVRSNLGSSYPLIINGQSVDTKEYTVSINPANPNDIVGRVAAAEPPHADRAIVGATEAFNDWAALSMEARADYLFSTAQLLRERRDEFAAWEIFEAGKTWGEADANVTEAIDFLEYYGREAMRLGVIGAKAVPGETNALIYRPRGVGLIIPPWNFPLAILTGMLSGAIVTGNTVILKPSSQTPVIAAKFMELLREVELPSGVVQFVPGTGSGLGEYLVKNPRVQFIAFTGSMEVGTRIMRLASEISHGQDHIKRVIAEMGGKNAIIVDSDADLDDAVLGTVHSAFGYQGQKCSAASRVIVVGRHYDLFLHRLVEATRSLKIGVPEDPEVGVGPVIGAVAFERIRQAIALGRETTDIALEIDCSDKGPGFFIGPTIFSHVPVDSPLAQEEIFGPVLAVMHAEDFDKALEIANSTRYALTGGVYSRSPANIAKAYKEFQVGNLYINRQITGALVGRQPFGGFKLSGTGGKAGGPDYLLQFVTPHTVTENTLRRGFAPSKNIAAELGGL
ncbi:MAG: L-glutamate gamma-semialdehyde dehydrogenase [Gammaproteobacteria bacterium]|nr:L-glutamate gamma-semialdehyde dehydrogenase [Gammaproteobacteria bacterium]